MKEATVKIGRHCVLRAANGEPGEFIVVAVAVRSEATVTSIMSAATLVLQTTDDVLAKIPHARRFGEPRMRNGWHPAVVQEIVAPVGEAAKHGIKPQRGKL